MATHEPTVEGPDTAAALAGAPDAAALRDGRPSESAAVPRYVLWLLLIIYVFNFVDRQVMAILAEPIKQELHLQDWHIGILTGLGFVLVYVLLGIPIAWLADRFHRPTILAAGVAIWSVATGLSAVATTFSVLLLCRISVGFGEAGCTPTAHSLISDYTPPEKRASALAFYSLGNPLGILAGLAIGGVIAQNYRWRAAFVIVAVPGLLLTLLAYFLLPEPRQGRAARAPRQAASKDVNAIRLWRKPAYWLLSVGVGFSTFLVAGPAAFIAPYLLRTQTADLRMLADQTGAVFGVTLKPLGFLGIALGVTIGICGVIGTWLGGVLADRFSSGGGNNRYYMILPAIGAAVAAAFLCAAWLVPYPAAVIGLTGLGFLAASLASAPVYAAVQSLAAPSLRALAAAVMLFCLNLLGGLGPLVVGIVSDVFTAQVGTGAALRIGLVASASSGLIAATLFILAGARLQRDRQA